MNSFHMKSIFILLLGISALISCKTEEESPVEPSAYGTIKGVVTEQESGNFIKNVSITSEPATSLVTTDENGIFLINTVEPGDYKIFAVKDGYDSNSVDVTVTAGAETISNFIMQESDSSGSRYYGQISGIVRNSETNLPITKVNITTVPATHSVSTDEIGKYQLLNVPAGEYTIISTKAMYDTVRHTIVVQIGSTTYADFFLTKIDTSTVPTTGNIKGNVRDAFTGLGISGVVISTSPTTSVVTTSSDGSYSINNLIPGAYTISASKAEYQGTTINVSVTAGKDTKADIVLTSSYGSITGYVKNAITELPIQGVNIQTDPATSSVTSNSDGKYTILNVLPGEYSIKATKNGFIDSEISVVVSEGNQTVADIQMISGKK